MKKVIHIIVEQDLNIVNEYYIIENRNKGKIEITTEPVDILIENVITIAIEPQIYWLAESILFDSKIHRKKLLKYFKKRLPMKICVKLTFPVVKYVDKKGNSLFENLGLERREVDHAMAWFSTLGGAFSALGDIMENCAVMAGKISVQQFKLALKLDDPFLLARCRLWLALSLVQRKQFKIAAKLVKDQYKFASQTKTDTKLIAMCHGIWTKLKYERNLYRKLKSKVK